MSENPSALHMIGRPPALAMGQIVLAGEADAGRKPVWPHLKRLPTWLRPEDWSVWPVIAYDKREVHIIAISSARKGALRRLVDSIGAAGLTPVIVEPLGVMHAILAKWGWQKTVLGAGWDAREEWRPAHRLTKETLGG